MKTINCKLGNMRKSVSWVVYPRDADDTTIIIQCDKRICKFDKNTGEGVLSASHNYPGFITLALPGCTNVIVPPEVREAAIEAMPKKGDAIGKGVFIG